MIVGTVMSIALQLNQCDFCTRRTKARANGVAPRIDWIHREEKIAFKGGKLFQQLREIFAVEHKFVGPIKQHIWRTQGLHEVGGLDQFEVKLHVVVGFVVFVTGGVQFGGGGGSGEVFVLNHSQGGIESNAIGQMFGRASDRHGFQIDHSGKNVLIVEHQGRGTGHCTLRFLVFGVTSNNWSSEPKIKWQNRSKLRNRSPPPITITMVFRLCYLATLTTLALSAPSDFAGSFAHVSSGNAPQKLTSNHFNKADQITKAASSLRSSSQAQATEFKTAKSRFIESTTDALAATHKAKHGAAVEHTNAVNTIRPDRIATPVAVSNNAAVATETNDKHLTNAVAATYHTSMLEVASTSQSQLEMKGASDCEVCVYVVENKQMHQPFLCRGLKDPAYQQTVSK